MKRTFSDEDNRKDKLFEAWITYLRGVHNQLSEPDFEEIYEGVATISELSKNYMELQLEDGRKLRHIPISPEIGQLSIRLDSLFVVIGRKDTKWLPLDVISIGSILDYKNGQCHVTFNPLLIDCNLIN